ncbi:MAG: diacylglycerol O-acyltransferase / wax synthase [Mycobacterium sp.]|nr:diacylglycerol O-acyltransferase / wax synthase [Mycobacterium sp.]
MKRLNGMDALLLYSETPNVHTHTLKIAILDTGDRDVEFGFDEFRQALAQRLHLLEPLRYKLVDIPWWVHHPRWLQNCEVDLDYHLRRVQVPAPGGRRELDRVIGEVASTPLDRHHPLWEFHFANGLAGGRCALIGKVHHALADGVASANLLARAMDPDGSFSSESVTTDACTPRHRQNCWRPRVATICSSSPRCPASSATLFQATGECTGARANEANSTTLRERCTPRRRFSTMSCRRCALSPAKR